MIDPQKACRVWATRPIEQNQIWLQTLEQADYEVVDLPLLAIEPLADADATQAVKNLVLDLDQFQKVIFVSQNAVAEAFRWFEDYWPQLPQGIEYFAVGQKTAEAVARHQVGVVSGGLAMNSDELLGLPQLQDVWGQRILICRGQGGLPRLGEVLHDRGAIVRYCELYKRCLPQHSEERLNWVFNSLTGHDLVPVFSGETLQNLDTIVAAHNPAVRQRLALVVPGKRVAKMALAMGYQDVLVANNASVNEMLAAVEAWREALIRA